MPMTTRSLSTPITLTSVAVALSLALLVGWTLLVVDTLSSGTTWFLILGVVSIAFITTVLLMSGIALAREIVEGRRQRTFVDSVTHELKSPLASLGLCLETLSRSDLSEAQRAELRAMMRHDVERLSAFIDDVLVASRLAHGRRDPEPRRSVRVAEVFARANERVMARHSLASPELSIEIPETLTAATDPTALETILRNLLDNAMKYSARATPTPDTEAPRGGTGGETPTIAVKAAVNEGMLVLEVSDRGIGIAEPDLQRIFRRFYRADADDVRARSGTGLGLYVASELAVGLGGKLSARSDGVGCGSTFTLEIPLGRTEAARR
jgi:signal transduction histidine kinase